MLAAIVAVMLATAPPLVGSTQGVSSHLPSLSTVLSHLVAGGQALRILHTRHAACGTTFTRYPFARRRAKCCHNTKVGEPILFTIPIQTWAAAFLDGAFPSLESIFFSTHRATYATPAAGLATFNTCAILTLRFPAENYRTPFGCRVWTYVLRWPLTLLYYSILNLYMDFCYYPT